MKRKPQRPLWLYFAAIVFVIMLITACTMAFLAVILFRFGQLRFQGHMPLLPIFMLLFISVIMGTLISLFVGGKILKPVTRLSESLNEVAKGNFDIRIDEGSNVPELRDFAHNFNLMIHELSSIETLRSSFVSNISHEFKTPIAAIEGYATLLQDTELSDIERAEYTRMVIESSRQLSELSGNVLSLSKLENQEVLIDRSTFRLDEQLREAILLLENEWTAKELELKLDLNKLDFTGDRGLLLIVWKNLIDNAVKFSVEKGSMSVLLHSDESAVTVKVADTGCGMNEETRRHAFDKFYQGDTARKTSGNGLGLALVVRIVQLHEGRVDIESTKGKGSTFIVRLPVKINSSDTN